jgi:hypothetical protein
LLRLASCPGPWRSLRGGEINARIELDLHLRESAEGGLALDAAGQAIGMWSRRSPTLETSPAPKFRDRYGKEGSSIRGLTFEQHIARLGEELMPLAERFGRIMREAIAALEGLRTVPNQSVERLPTIAIPIISLLERGCP